MSLTQEPFKNRWYETEAHGYERKNEAVLPRCNDETREKSGGGKTNVPSSAFRDRMIESLSFCHAVFLHLEEMENSLSYLKECPRS